LDLRGRKGIARGANMVHQPANTALAADRPFRIVLSCGCKDQCPLQDSVPSFLLIF